MFMRMNRVQTFYCCRVIWTGGHSSRRRTRRLLSDLSSAAVETWEMNRPHAAAGIPRCRWSGVSQWDFRNPGTCEIPRSGFASVCLNCVCSLKAWRRLEDAGEGWVIFTTAVHSTVCLVFCFCDLLSLITEGCKSLGRFTPIDVISRWWVCGPEKFSTKAAYGVESRSELPLYFLQNRGRSLKQREPVNFTGWQSWIPLMCCTVESLSSPPAAQTMSWCHIS